MALSLYMSHQEHNTPQILSVAEAATHYRVTPATIRRWIKAGRLRAYQQRTAQGFEWRIYVLDHGDQVGEHTSDQGVRIIEAHMTAVQDQPTDHPAPRDQVANDQVASAHDHVPTDRDQALTAAQEAVLRALDLADRLYQENQSLRRQLEQAQERIKLLEAPKEPVPQNFGEPPQPEPEPPSEPRSPLWQWVRRRLSRT